MSSHRGPDLKFMETAETAVDMHMLHHTQLGNIKGYDQFWANFQFSF